MYPLLTGLVISDIIIIRTLQNTQENQPLLGVEDTVYITLLFSLVFLFPVVMNSVVTYTVSSTPSKSQKI